MTGTRGADASDLYERLGVPVTATLDEIRRAYRRLVRRYTPERAPEQFKRIREAYEILSDPNTRQEYDTRPDPQVEAWLAAAMQAMRQDDYATAERHFKRVLVQCPELSYARNLLGLCFLYQDQPEKAIVQYQRLLESGSTAPAVLGNAAHAHRALGRWAGAEILFRKAIDTALAQGADATNYYAGLADTYIGQEKYGEAVDLLERAIQADGKIDFQDLQYFTKLLEIAVRRRKESEVARALSRVKDIAADEEQRRYLAMKLGLIAQDLIVAGGYTYAKPVAACARELDPGDRDYVMLDAVAELLERRRFAAVLGLLGSEAPFGPDGWLRGLGTYLTQYCTKNRALEGLESISGPPTLYTINGIGTALYGRRDEDAVSGTHVATLYFVVLFLPLMPLRCYRVRDAEGGGWHFFGRVPFSRREKIHASAVAAAVALWIFASAFGDEPGRSYTNQGATHAASPAPASSTPFGQPPASRAVQELFVEDSTGQASNEGEGRGSLAEKEPTFYASGDAFSRDRLGRWIETERARIRWLESEISRKAARLRVQSDELDRLKRKVESYEAMATDGALPEGIYQAYEVDLHQYNLAVDEFNSVLGPYKDDKAEYQSALQAINDSIDRYNRMR